MLNKNRVVHLALPDMSRFDPPKADNALLGFLIGVLSLVSIFALCMYWGMQPTVLVHAGTTTLKRQVSCSHARVPRLVVERFMIPSRLTCLHEMDSIRTAVRTQSGERRSPN